MNLDQDSQQLLAELDALRHRVGELERRRARRPVLVAFAVGVALAAGGTFAANGNCPNGLPFCFAANEPARAAQVNHNFAQMKEWMEAKIGDAGTPGVQATSVTATNLTVNGGRLTGNNAASNFHIDPAGARLYLNWFGGNDGLVFGNGAQGQVARLTSGGTMSLNGGLNGAGSLCIKPVDCAWEGQFTCGGSGTCSSGKVMIGFQDGTGCSAVNQAWCCRLALSTGCP